MEDVYITNANFRKLLRKTKTVIKIQKHEFLKEVCDNPQVYDRLYYLQRIELYKASLILKERNFKILDFNPIDPIPHKERKVFNDVESAYHRDRECIYFKLNYFNILIPPEAKELDKKYEKNISEELKECIKERLIAQLEVQMLENEDYKKDVEEVIKKFSLNGYRNDKSLKIILGQTDFNIDYEDLVNAYNLKILRYTKYKDEEGEPILKTLSPEYKGLVVKKDKNSGEHIIAVLEREQKLQDYLKEMERICYCPDIGIDLFDLGQISYCIGKTEEYIYKKIKEKSLEEKVQIIGGIGNVKKFWKKYDELCKKIYNWVWY